MKLVVYNLRDFDEKEYFDKWCGQYGYEYIGTQEAPTYENAELARGADAISIIPTPMRKDLIDCFHEMGVRYITTRAIGYDHIDVAYAHQRGMRVSNVRYSPDSVANYAIMLMLIGCRNYIQIYRRGCLQDYTLKGCMGRELSDCTVGVIGTGRIGAAVIRHLSAFGCQLLAYDKYHNPEVESLAQYTEMDQLLAEADVITLHLPGLSELYHLLDRDAFQKMKPGMILVNSARGTLIDEEALIEALEGGIVAFAALDTVERETGLYYNDKKGMVLDNRNLSILRSMPNVVITPHMAFYTGRAISDQIECTIKSLYAFENGEPNPTEIL